MAADYTYSMNMKLACSTHCCWGTTWWSLCTPPGRPCRYRWVSLENQTGQYLNRAIRWRINTALLQSGNKQTERGENPFLPTISPFCHRYKSVSFMTNENFWRTSIIPGTVTLTSLILWRTEQWRTRRPNQTLQ